MAEKPDPTAVMTCPECSATIPPDALLFDYQFSSGDQGVIKYAKCNSCDSIVHPNVERKWLE